MESFTRNEIRKLCRICLKIQPHMRFLSSSELIDGRFCTLYHMLKTCTSVQVSVEDELPNMICQLCINRLYASWEFKKDCENSEAKLHQIINSTINNKKREEAANLPTNSCEIITNNDNSKIKQKVIRVIAVKNLKNNLKVFNKNIGQTTKNVIIKNIDQILKENNIDFHNNNVSQNNSENQIRIENKNATKSNLVILKNPPVILEYKNVNESPKNNNHYFEEIENINLNSDSEMTSIENISADSSSQFDDDDIKPNFNLSLPMQIRDFDTIDLTLSDSEENIEKERTNRDESNIENTNLKITEYAHLPKQKKVFLKKHVFIKKFCRKNKCIYCTKMFPSKLRLQNHMKTHIDAEAHCCPNCDKKFTLFSNLEMHLKTHKEAYFLKCPKCPKYFSSKLTLNKHKKIHEVKTFDCGLCCKNFYSQTSLRQHLNFSHSGINKYFCDVCMKGFTLKIMLKHHRQTHIQDNSFKCNICEIIFPTFDELTEHNSTHAPGIGINNDKCDEVLATNDDLVQDRDTELSTESDTKSAPMKPKKSRKLRTKSRTCKMCDAVFDSLLKFRSHMKTHIICKICLESFQSLRSLNIHKKQHYVESPVCLHCNKKFHSFNSFSKHLEICN